MKIVMTASGNSFRAMINDSTISGQGSSKAEAIGNAIIANEVTLGIEIKMSEATQATERSTT